MFTRLLSHELISNKNYIWCLLQNIKAVSNLFVGTKDKCVGCEKTVYPIEKVTNRMSLTLIICFNIVFENKTANLYIKKW